MKTNLRKLFKTRALLPSMVVVLLVLALAAGGVLANPSQAPSSAAAMSILPAETCTYDGLSNTRTCEFWAVAGTVDLPGWAGMPIWGFTDTDPALGGVSQLPGPTIIANQGETVEVILHNNLAENTAMVFPGQEMMPDLNGVAPGGSATYSFAASHAGTYLYEAGLLPGAQYQVAMGLYGALIIRPAIISQAYGTASTFEDEAVLVLSEIDPDLNTSASPAAFDMRDYAPKFNLINGQAYPDTDEIISAAGNRVLLRFVNAGIEQHSMGMLGVDQQIIAVDGSPLAFPYRIVGATIGSGQTSDRMVLMPNPSPAGGAMFALYDTSLLLHNNGAAGFGGMLTFISISDGTPPVTGPTASSVALSIISPFRI